MTIFSTATERSCQLTGRSFEISDRERALWESFQLALPVLAPEERIRRLAAFVSGTTLEKRKCDATQQEIISTFSSHAPFPVYSEKYWWSDKWDPMSFAQPFNFKRLFMEQFLDFWRQVPRPSLWILGRDERSANEQQAESRIAESVHDVDGVVNCSMVFASENSENCRYTVKSSGSKGCLDTYDISGCDACYECVCCTGCSRVRFADTSTACHDSWLLSNCFDCRFCVGCTNLTGARYHIFNEPYSESDYFAMLEGFGLNARPLLELAKNRFREIHSREPVPHMYADHPSANSGNYLYNTHLCIDCFECRDSTDLVNCLGAWRSRTVLDGVNVTNIESSVQVASCVNGAFLLNVIACQNVERLSYCSFCTDSKDLFGCVGLRGKQFCIFNQQYSEDEYRSLLKRIEEHLRGRSAWGACLPPGFSGYAYNRSFAGTIMPLTKVPAKMMAFPWDERSDRLVIPTAPDGGSPAEEHFSETPENMNALDGVELSSVSFLCSISGQPFQLTDWERDFAVGLGLPPPEHCPEERHAHRLALLTPRQITVRESLPDQQPVRTSIPARWKQPLVRVEG